MASVNFIEQKDDLNRNVWRFYFGSDCNLYKILGEIAG